MMIIEACKAAGGFWFTDDQTIAMFGAFILVFFLGIRVGENQKK